MSAAEAATKTPRKTHHPSKPPSVKHRGGGGAPGGPIGRFPSERKVVGA